MALLRNEYNRQSQLEFEQIRDFIILHYHQTERSDSPFWNYCRTMPVPDELTQKIQQFKANGRIFRFNNEMFSDLSWFEVMLGQGIEPQAYHPMADLFPEAELAKRLEGIRSVIRKSVDYMPSHQSFIDQFCKAGKVY